MTESSPADGQELPGAAFGEAVGACSRMLEIFQLLEKTAPTEAWVLLGGESGTGKDLLARSIHRGSRRAGSLVVVDCGALLGSQGESELFGHEKGASSGAGLRRVGALESAQGGTLFLDEIDELAWDLQWKLVRALEHGQIRPGGGERELAVDVRVLAAAGRDLRREVERGKFCQDLYARLRAVHVQLPPLRERRGDLRLLGEHLLQQFHSGLSDESSLGLGVDVLAVLEAHDWPGNVRELRNVLESAAELALAAGRTRLAPEDLPPAVASRTSVRAPRPEFRPDQSYRQTRAQWEAHFEKTYVEWLLDRHGGNVSGAAREAEMDRKYLYKLAKKHGLR